MTAPVVLLHALAVPSGMWAAPAAALAAAGHDVVAFDQRGYGDVPLGSAEPSLGLVADDLARRLDAAGYGTAVLAGCSMGGYVALEFARRHPGRLAGLALLSTRAVADTPEAAEGRRRFAAAITDPGHRAQLIAMTVPQLLAPEFARSHPDVMESLHEAVSGVSPEAVAWSQRAIAAREGALDVLAATDVPAVVLHGTADRLTSAEDARLMAEALPRALLVPVTGAGHLIPLEEPDVVTTSLLNLLEESAAVTS